MACKKKPEWIVREPNEEDLEVISAGKVEDSAKRGKEKIRDVVTKTLLFTFCFILVAVVTVGITTGDWKPMSEVKSTVTWAFGYFFGHFLPRR